jgi:hypothetical protein
MAAKLGIVVIHGMGSQTSTFADEMIEEINMRVDDLGKNREDIAWKPIFWANILAGRQSEYLRDAKSGNDLDYIGLRKFMLSAFGDASAYQKVGGGADNTYGKIHKRIETNVRSLYQTGLQSKSKPLLVMAHSLGGHIMSNYIWDMQHSQNNPASPFERMESLAGMITFGCNIPLFTFAYGKVVPIEFPPKTLPAGLKRKAKWLNYYDPDDVLAYPLRAINTAYKNTVTKDIAINVGGLLSSWNPLCHSEYWTDNTRRHKS